MATCPHVDPLRPPSLGRGLPGVLQYGATCLPGTVTATGCAADQMNFVLLIPWDKVKGIGLDTHERAWTAPGGNRYYSSSVPVAAKPNPVAAAILRLMAQKSRQHVQGKFSGEYKNETMQAMLTKYRGKLAVQHGVVKVEILPDPNESADRFVRRGGYLLWTDPATGPFHGKVPVDGYKPSWLGGDIASCDLHAVYNVAEARIDYAVRVVYKATWQRAIDGSVGRIFAAKKKLCEGINSDTVTTVMTYAQYYPSPETQTYVRAWQAASAACGLTSMPCTPRTDQPLPPATPGFVPGYAPGGRKSMMADVGQLLTPMGVFTMPSPMAPSAPKYPIGSIAWLDAKAPGYRIAVPAPGKGVTHAILSAGVSSVLPVGLPLVTKREWERATLPLWQRSSTKIGAMIGGIVVASAATLYVSRPRQR